MRMAETTADVMVQSLISWGVKVIFGIPGDGINGVVEALRKRRDNIMFVQTRHEEAAALMACGYAKFTGRLGVCLATSGPGGIHLLNGLYDAALDGQPVVAITGMAFHDPPAKVTLDQAAKFARSLLRGEPNSQKIALTVLGERIRELV